MGRLPFTTNLPPRRSKPDDILPAERELFCRTPLEVEIGGAVVFNGVPDDSYGLCVPEPPQPRFFAPEDIYEPPKIRRFQRCLVTVGEGITVRAWQRMS